MEFWLQLEDIILTPRYPLGTESWFYRYIAKGITWCTPPGWKPVFVCPLIVPQNLFWHQILHGIVPFTRLSLWRFIRFGFLGWFHGGLFAWRSRFQGGIRGRLLAWSFVGWGEGVKVWVYSHNPNHWSPQHRSAAASWFTCFNIHWIPNMLPWQGVVGNSIPNSDPVCILWYRHESGPVSRKNLPTFCRTW